MTKYKNYTKFSETEEEVELRLQAEAARDRAAAELAAELAAEEQAMKDCIAVEVLASANVKPLPEGSIVVTDLGQVTFISGKYVDSNGTVITDGYELLAIPDSEFLTGAPVPVIYEAVLSANAVILLNDIFFQATKGTTREFHVREPNATRLGMTVSELESAAQELVLSGKALRNPARTSLISQV